MKKLNLRYWKLEGNFAIFNLPNGSEYDIHLPNNIDWLEHIRQKPWATKPVLDELRAILKAKGCLKESDVA